MGSSSNTAGAGSSIDLLDLLRHSRWPRQRLLGKLFDQSPDAARGRDRGAHLAPRDRLDVAETERVERVLDGDDHGSVSRKRHRHRAIALGGGAGHHLGSACVDGKLIEVDVIEAVALGDGTRELLLIEDPGFEHVALEGLLRLLGRLDGGVHRLPVGEAELDDDVVEKYAAAVGVGGRGDPGGPDLETGDAPASRAGEELGHSGATCEARSESVEASSARLRASAGVEVSASGWTPQVTSSGGRVPLPTRSNAAR